MSRQSRIGTTDRVDRSMNGGVDHCHEKHSGITPQKAIASVSPDSMVGQRDSPRHSS